MFLEVALQNILWQNDEEEPQVTIIILMSHLRSGAS